MFAGDEAQFSFRIIIVAGWFGFVGMIEVGRKDGRFGFISIAARPCTGCLFGWLLAPGCC